MLFNNIQTYINVLTAEIESANVDMMASLLSMYFCLPDVKYALGRACLFNQKV